MHMQTLQSRSLDSFATLHTRPAYGRANTIASRHFVFLTTGVLLTDLLARNVCALPGPRCMVLFFVLYSFSQCFRLFRRACRVFRGLEMRLGGEVRLELALALVLFLAHVAIEGGTATALAAALAAVLVSPMRRRIIVAVVVVVRVRGARVTTLVVGFGRRRNRSGGGLPRVVTVLIVAVVVVVVRILGGPQFGETPLLLGLDLGLPSNQMRPAICMNIGEI